jgi:hypothetical protein
MKFSPTLMRAKLTQAYADILDLLEMVREVEGCNCLKCEKIRRIKRRVHYVKKKNQDT